MQACARFPYFLGGIWQTPEIVRLECVLWLTETEPKGNQFHLNNVITDSSISLKITKFFAEPLRGIILVHHSGLVLGTSSISSTVAWSSKRSLSIVNTTYKFIGKRLRCLFIKLLEHQCGGT